MATIDRDWSKFPEDLLILVFHLLPIPDLLRSSSVCATWSSAVRELGRQFRPFLHRSPWLMLHEIVNGRPNTKFYSLSERRSYTIPVLYDPLSDHVIGSSHGWLILANERSDIYLLNPITGARIDDLPLIATWDYVEAVHDERGFLEGYAVVEDGERVGYDAHEIREFYHKAILSSRPSDGNYALMVVTSFSNMILQVFSRAGVKQWTTIAAAADTVLHQDIAFHNEEFYLITSNGILRVLDLNGNQKASVLLSWSSEQEIIDDVNFVYVVPCPSGEDVYVVRISKDMDGKLFFVVCRSELNGFGREIKVVELRSLGNYGMIVGSAADSMCLSCTEYPELRPNCIYINQNHHGTFGIYDIEDGSLKFTFTATDQGKGWLPPTWFIPSL